MHRNPFSATSMAHLLMAQVLSPGDRCIDATAGNGHDTVFLRQQVGERGEVTAIDLQSTAIDETDRLLREMGLQAGCRLVRGDHAELQHIVATEWVGTTRVICFNLGYLPGGDKQCTTTTELTLQALEAALAFLAPGGILVVTAYPGHAEGARECNAVAAFMDALPADRYAVYRYSTVNTASGLLNG